MTNEEYLKSLDVPGRNEANTVTIPLAYYNKLIKDHVTLMSIYDFAKNSSALLNFTDTVKMLLEIKEADNDA